MPKIITDEAERSVRVNVCVKNKILQKLDQNVIRFQSYLMSHGISPEDAKKVTRSALIGEMVESLATEAGLLMLQSGVALKFGLDNSQIEMKFD